MAKKACIICERLSTTDEEGSTESPASASNVNFNPEKGPDQVTRFFNLLGRYVDDNSFGEGNNKHLSDGVGVIHDGMVCCRECSKLVKSFCELYHQMISIQLLLNWNVQKLKQVMSSEQGLLGDESWQGFEGKIQHFLDFKRELVKKCEQKLSAALPKISIFRGQSQCATDDSTNLSKNVEDNMAVKLEPDVPDSSEQEITFGLRNKTEAVVVVNSITIKVERPDAGDGSEHGDNDDEDPNPDWDQQSKQPSSSPDTDDGDDGEKVETVNQTVGKAVAAMSLKSNCTLNRKTGKRECKLCSKNFDFYCHFRDHFRAVHLKLKYKCSYEHCTKEYNFRKDRSRHYQSVHKDVKYNCDACNKSFVRKDNLRQHKLKNVCGRRGRDQVSEVSNTAPKCITVTPKHHLPSEEKLATNSRSLGAKVSNGKKNSKGEPDYIVDSDLSSGDSISEEEDDPGTTSHPPSGMGDSKQLISASMNGMKCDECGKLFARKRNLVRHRRNPRGLCKGGVEEQQQAVTSSPGGFFKCDICSKQFTRRSDVKRHHDNVHLKVKYKCGVCDKSFSDKSGLGYHDKRVHMTNGSNKETDYIGDSDLSADSDDDDDDEESYSILKEETTKKISEVGEEDATASTSSIPPQSPSIPPTISAPVAGEIIIKCGKLSTVKKDLVGHQRNAGLCEREIAEQCCPPPGGNFQCSICSKRFQRKDGLERHHANIHLKLTYKCSLCSRSFSDKRLRRLHHQRVHVQRSVPFKGRNRNRSFPLPSNSQNHQRAVDQGTSPNLDMKKVCSYCGKQFGRAAALRKHENAVHLKLRRFVCDREGCGKGFCMPHHLRNHIISVHLELREHLCDLCGVEFKLKKNLDAHRRNVHQAV